MRVSWSSDIEDPDEPARLLNRLESTGMGCAWLLDRWGELQDLLDGGLKWQSPDRFKAIRLLGKQPLDPVLEPQVTAALHGRLGDGAGGQAPIRRRLQRAARRRAEAVRRAAQGREAWEEAPESPEAGRTALVALVAEQVNRLEELLARHLDRDAAAGVDRLEFDDSHAGELVRRYQLSCNRTLVRVLQTYFKVRNEVQRAGEDPPPRTRRSTRRCVPLPGIRRNRRRSTSRTWWRARRGLPNLA